MSVQVQYDQWSATYDTVENRTRDLEKVVCETLLGVSRFERVLEIGSGTGKNTAWLAERAEHVLSVDLSAEMQAVAKAKVDAVNVEFRIADVRKPWSFGEDAFDLITCSLILEHVEDLEHVFAETARSLRPGGLFYVCELHPFKQYSGSKARFASETGESIVECYTHHVSDYTKPAADSGFVIERLDEWFDDDDRMATPRLISFLFRR